MTLLKAQDVAKLLGCSMEFVYKNRQLLGGIKIGKLVRFQLNMINEVINGRETREEISLLLHSERSETSEGGLPKQRRSEGSRGKGKNASADDEYGLYQIVQQSVKGGGTTEE